MKNTDEKHKVRAQNYEAKVEPALFPLNGNTQVEQKIKYERLPQWTGLFVEEVRSLQTIASLLYTQVLSFSGRTSLGLMIKLDSQPAIRRSVISYRLFTLVYLCISWCFFPILVTGRWTGGGQSWR